MAMYEEISIERLSGKMRLPHSHLLRNRQVTNGALQLAILVPLKSGFRKVRGRQDEVADNPVFQGTQ